VVRCEVVKRRWWMRVVQRCAEEVVQSAEMVQVQRRR
jgi:hypothetical protein